MKRVVVSGVTGHLGLELARKLIAADVEVIGLTRQNSTSGIESGIKIRCLDGSTETLTDVLGEVQPDVIFHVASLYRRVHRSSDVHSLIDSNILFGAQILEAMRAVGCSKIVSAGSYFQHYGVGEAHALNLYAATKCAFDELLKYYADEFKISAICLTLADIYSENDRRPRLMTDIAAAWRGKTSLSLLDEEVWIDLVHVEDAAMSFCRAAELLEERIELNSRVTRYSVSSGYTIASRELISLFERLGGRKLVVNRGNGWRLARRMKPWRGQILPGWSPQISLAEGVARVLQNCGRS